MTVTDTTTYQTWDGFGGAFNEMGWDDIQQLSAADQDARDQASLRRDGRRAASSSAASRSAPATTRSTRYTLDESANDYTMTNFSIAHDRTMLIPYVKAALAVNPNLRLWASPWTPPTWMKTTSGTVSGASCAPGSTPTTAGA